jgi:flagellar biosynthesis protein FlhA
VRTQDPDELTREVRIALSPSIVQQIFGPVKELSVIAIEPSLENLLVQALTPGPHRPWSRAWPTM